MGPKFWDTLSLCPQDEQSFQEGARKEEKEKNRKEGAEAIPVWYLPGAVYKTQSFLVEEGREGGEMWGQDCLCLLLPSPVYPTAEEFLPLLPAKPVRIHTSPLLWPPFPQSEIISSLLTCFHLCPLQLTLPYNIRPIFQQCSQTTLPST